MKGLKALALSVGGVVALATAVSATPITIDSFNNGGTTLTRTLAGTNTALQAGPIADVLGGARKLSLTNLTGLGDATMRIDFMDNNRLSVSNDDDVRSIASILYDQNNAPTGFAPAVDLLSAGFGFSLSRRGDNASGSIIIEVTDSDGDTATRSISTVSSGVVWVDAFALFSSFTNYSNTDFSSVRTIRLTIDASSVAATALDQSIDFFVTSVPEPATFGTLGLALVGLGTLAYRRRKV